MQSNQNAYILALILYLGITVVISALRALAVKDQKDFMVGGRKVSTFMMVMTLVATWTGAGSLIGGAGLAYRQGYSELWMSVGAWIGILIVYKWAGRVRKIAEYTLPDLLEKRYNAAARLFGSLAMIIGCVTIVGYQLKGGAYILEVTTNIPWNKGVMIIGAAVIVLTLLGGMRSVVALDLLNGLMILFGIGIAALVLFFDIGGVGGMTSSLPKSHFSILGGHSLVWGISVMLPVLLLLLGEPSMYQKFFSTESESTARKAVIGWVIGVILVDLLICTVAILGRIKFPHLGEEGVAERVILDVARKGLPVWGGVLLLAAALAVIFSTADSFLLTASTNLTHDIIERFIVKGDSKQKIVLINRVVVVLFGVIAYLLLTRFRNVLTMAIAAYTMIGAGVTPAVIAAFFWKRATPGGGLASIIGGIIGTIAAKVACDIVVVQRYFEAHFGIPSSELGEYVMIPAALLAFGMLVLVSLIQSPPAPSKWEPFIEK